VPQAVPLRAAACATGAIDAQSAFGKPVSTAPLSLKKCERHLLGSYLALFNVYM